MGLTPYAYWKRGAYRSVTPGTSTGATWNSEAETVYNEMVSTVCTNSVSTYDYPTHAKKLPTFNWGGGAFCRGQRLKAPKSSVETNNTNKVTWLHHHCVTFLQKSMKRPPVL